MEIDRPDFGELEEAFASTRLEPEVTDSVLVAYAAGRATEAEREIVETMMEVDPAISDVVAVLRDELNRLHEPLPAIEAGNAPRAKRTPWASFRIPALAFGVTACVLLLFVASVATKERNELAASRRDNVALQDEVSVLGKRVRLKSIVEEALAHGLKTPPFAADLAATRGEIQLDLTMTPNKTVVSQPVELRWSGRDAASGVDYGIEVTNQGSTVWKGQSSRGTVDIPSSALGAGKSFSWRVTRGTKASDWSSFRVCTVAEAEQIAAIESDPELGPLDRGVLYARAGFVNDAVREFETLKKTDPELSQRLIRELGLAAN